MVHGVPATYCRIFLLFAMKSLINQKRPMKKAHSFFVGLAVSVILFSASQLAAAPVKPALVINPAAMKTAPQTATPSLQPASKIIGQKMPLLAPDLAVMDVGIGSDCYVTWTIKNRGPGKLKEAAYALGTGVRVVGNSSTTGNFGGLFLNTLDPSKALKRPGGELSYKDPYKCSAQGDKIGITLQNARVSGDVNPGNNRLLKSLKCESAIRKPQTNQFTTVQPRVTIESLRLNCSDTNYCVAGAQITLFGSPEPLQLSVKFYLQYPDGSILSLGTVGLGTPSNYPGHVASSGLRLVVPLPDGTALAAKVFLVEPPPPYTKALGKESVILN